MRVLLLSNVNMQPLVGFLKPWEVTCGEYNSILIDLSVPGSLVDSGDFSHVLCLFDSDVMMGDAFHGQGSARQCEVFLCGLEAFCTRYPEKVVVTNSFCFSSNRWLSFADLLHPASLAAAETTFNAQLVALAKAHPNLLLIDLGLLFRRYGEDSLISPSFWYAGRIRYTNQMFRALATTIQQALAAYASRSRKVIVLDLDNTLWGGIVGELGPSGIALSEDGEGRCYRDFQRFVKAVQQTGVLLAVCSKNNLADVEQVFESNSMMILHLEDFVSIRVNWQPKTENIMDIAETLDLGLDSFVFIDDSPVEREIVTATLPEIAVPTFPDRIEDLPSWFIREIVPCYFGRYTITAEDGARTKQYQTNGERRRLGKKMDLDTFLTELQIECTFCVDQAACVARITQMTQRTNQFNLTSRRYEIPDINRFIEHPDYAVLALDYRDRFGSEGSVALAILDFTQGRIDTLLLSCRVIGRKVEDRLLEEAFKLFRMRGIERVVGEFIPTRKNQVVATFYEAHGFTPAGELEGGRKLYERFIA